jgi:hypothetical protein
MSPTPCTAEARSTRRSLALGVIASARALGILDPPSSALRCRGCGATSARLPGAELGLQRTIAAVGAGVAWARPRTPQAIGETAPTDEQAHTAACTRAGRRPLGPPPAGLLRHRLRRTAAGQPGARPLGEPEGIPHSPEPGVRAQQTKEVFEMAASRLIEDESGTCTARSRPRHNGCCARDLSQAPLTVPDLRLTYLSSGTLLPLR